MVFLEKTMQRWRNEATFFYENISLINNNEASFKSTVSGMALYYSALFDFPGRITIELTTGFL